MQQRFYNFTQWLPNIIALNKHLLTYYTLFCLIMVFTRLLWFCQRIVIGICFYLDHQTLWVCKCVCLAVNLFGLINIVCTFGYNWKFIFKCKCVRICCSNIATTEKKKKEEEFVFIYRLLVVFLLNWKIFTENPKFIYFFVFYQIKYKWKLLAQKMSLNYCLMWWIGTKNRDTKRMFSRNFLTRNFRS